MCRRLRMKKSVKGAFNGIGIFSLMALASDRGAQVERRKS